MVAGVLILSFLVPLAIVATGPTVVLFATVAEATTVTEQKTVQPHRE